MQFANRRTIAYLLLPTAISIGLASLADRIAALHRLSPLLMTGFEAAPEDVRDDAGPFLDRRDTVEIVVPRRMTLGELLDLYRIDFRHVPPQIAAQTYPPARAPESVLDSGTRLRISLTRPDTATP